MNRSNLDLSNSNLLDEDVSYAAGTGQAIAAGVGAAAEGISKASSAKSAKEASKIEIERVVELSCGKKRWWWLKKRANKWKDCSKRVQDEYNKAKAAEQESKAALERERLEVEKRKLDVIDKKIATDEGNKILGMPKGLVIGLGIGVLALTGFIIYKKVIKK